MADAAAEEPSSPAVLDTAGAETPGDRDLKGEGEEEEEEDYRREVEHEFNVEVTGDETISFEFHPDSTCISGIPEESPASRAGILAGMAIVEVNGAEVNTPAEVEAAFATPDGGKAADGTQVFRVKCVWEEEDVEYEPFDEGMHAEVLRSSGKWTPCVIKHIDDENRTYTVAWDFDGEEQLKQVSFETADAGGLRHRIRFAKEQKVHALLSDKRYAPAEVVDVDVRRQVYIIRIPLEGDKVRECEVDFKSAALGVLAGDEQIRAMRAKRRAQIEKEKEGKDGTVAVKDAEGEKEKKDKPEDDDGPMWWVLGAGALLVILVTVIVVLFNDHDPTIPHVLHITVDENDTDANVMGVYVLESVDSPNGRPSWFNVEKRMYLFSSPAGLWTISTDEDNFATGSGYIASMQRHMGVMPHLIRPRAETRDKNTTGWQHASNNSWRTMSNIHVDAPHTFVEGEPVEWNSAEYGWRPGVVRRSISAVHENMSTANTTAFHIEDGIFDSWNLTEWPGTHVRRARNLSFVPKEETKVRSTVSKDSKTDKPAFKETTKYRRDSTQAQPPPASEETDDKTVNEDDESGDALNL